VKLLVVGREGQLAHSLQDVSSGTTTTLVAIGRPDLDVTDAGSVEAVFAGEHPDIVVNAAAYTAVDQAEREPARAHAINALGAESVAAACAARSIPVIHISTDFVFDGMKDGLYREDDPAPGQHLRAKQAGR
jgi:dTDP-4-dehydrorhamnose reductase